MKDKVITGAQIHQFNNIQPNAIPRSTFDRSFPFKTTHDSDYLYPIMNDEILPGDHIKLTMKSFTRMTTPLKPIMDNLYRDSHVFFVPMRLIWDNWQKFQGQQINPGDSTAYTIPIYDNTKAPLSTTGFAVGSLQDYMEIPPNVSKLADVSSMFERAYNLIFNEWYKDENLDTALPVPKGDGPDDPALFTLQKRRKRKDYRTSALPWPQKGAAVTVSIGGTAPVTGSVILNNANTNSMLVRAASGGGLADASTMDNAAGGVLTSWSSAATRTSVIDPNGRLSLSGATADLSGSTGISINSLRQLVTLQQMLELDARGGTRYTESLYARWGVIAQDARLQRPELVGEASSMINVYSVPQTAPTQSGTTPQGNLAAYATGMADLHVNYTAQEHGILIVLSNVRADLTYSQYLPRKRTRKTRTDFYEPIYANVGEMPVRNDEVYAQGTAADSQPFGYQEAWSTYRWKDAQITGLFRPYVPTNLAVWHLSQNFTALPVLNSSFITEAVPMDRISAVTTEPKFIMEGYFKYEHTRALPIRSNPGIERI